LTIPAAAFPQTLSWEQLTEGLAVAIWHPQGQCPEVPSFLVIDIDPQRYRFAVHSYRSDGFSTPPDIHQWQERTGHELIFNAGLFREDYSYLGLLYAKGRSLSGKRHATWMGLFVAEPVDSASPPAQVLDLTVDPFDEQRPTYHEAAQSLMLFDRAGSMRVRQSGKRSQQTVVSEQSNGHIWLLKSTDAVSLYAIGHCLQETFPEIRQAMAMDGGSSSDVALSARRRQAAGKSGGSHSWLSLLDDSSTVHIGLPAVIGISLRDEIKAIPAVKDKPARR
jgi:uncharacterized protein YigE (DUF2233 family)